MNYLGFFKSSIRKFLKLIIQCYFKTPSKEGYQPQTVVVDSSPNGWFIGSNLIFGGLIGWLIVDPFNGGMYTLSPDKVNVSLAGGSASHFQWQDGSLAVLLLEDVPLALRDQMVKVGNR